MSFYFINLKRRTVVSGGRLATKDLAAWDGSHVVKTACNKYKMFGDSLTLKILSHIY